MLSPQIKPARGTYSTLLGYSLTELAIVLAIIGLVAGTTLSVGKVQMDIAEFESTKERLETVRDALLLFQKKYERYPCPALPGDGLASGTYGAEVGGGCNGACPPGLSCGTNAVIGAVPFKTLRINEELAFDSWGGKFLYAVDKTHTVHSVYEFGNLPVVSLNGNEITASPVMGDAMFVLASHGQDGKGAYLKSGAQVVVCGTTGKDTENCNGDDTFMDSRFNTGDITASYYDDLVLWQTQTAIAPPKPPYHAKLDLTSGHVCVIKDDATVWCWGWNDSSQLGDGTTTDQFGTSMVQMTGITGAIELALVPHLTFVLKDDGTVWCAGDDFPGLCGDGPGHNSPSDRVELPGRAIHIASLSYGHSCALLEDGAVWCWGFGGDGELGNGGTSDTDAPVQVSSATGLIQAIQIAVGGSHSCAVKDNSTVWCWGNNSNGQLGDNSTTQRNTPVQVSGLTNVEAIALINETTCALKKDGTVWCWGAGLEGYLGNGTTPVTQMVPVQPLGMTNVRQLIGGYSTFCAVKSDNTMWCWGNNGTGQFGNGMGASTSATPDQTNITDVDVAAAGEYATCALKNDGTLWCWGQIFGGQLDPVQANFYP